MSDTQRLLEAAAALSHLLDARNIPHAFYGSVLTALLSNNPQASEIFCIVEPGQHHPFRRVREAVADSEHFTTTNSPWTNRFAGSVHSALSLTRQVFIRLHTTYRRVIPAIDIEILPAGEAGPRHLDARTVMKIQGVPFLTISEFIRAKLKSWTIRRLDADAQDISYLLTRYWNSVDINRIPEQDMKQLVARDSSAAPAWAAIKRKYRM